MINNNFISSPEDNRDYIFEDLYAADPNTGGLHIPLEYDPRKNLLPVRDQQVQGSCVSQSLAAIKEIQESKEVGFSEFMSPQFVYNLRSNFPGEGMYPRNAMSILKNIGIVPEELYNYNKIQNPKEMDEALLEIAKNYKAKSYARIISTEGIKKAVMLNGAVMICVPVYSGQDPIWKQKEGHNYITGGHAMTCVGWSKGGLIIRNSWNEKFGNDKNGYCFMPYSDLDQIKDKIEIWTVYDSDSEPDPQFTKWYFKWLRGAKNIIKNLHSLFYLSVVGFLLTLGIGFFEHTAWGLSAIIVLGLSVYVWIKKLWFRKD